MATVTSAQHLDREEGVALAQGDGSWRKLFRPADLASRDYLPVSVAIHTGDMRSRWRASSQPRAS